MLIPVQRPKHVIGLVRRGNMQITKNIIKISSLIVKIPKETKRVWDLSENRWGYRYGKAMCKR